MMRVLPTGRSMGQPSPSRQPGRVALGCYRRPLGRGSGVRILLVVNSFASSVTARNTVLVRQTLRQDHEVSLVETNRRGHATRFARDAAVRGVDVVVALGG